MTDSGNARQGDWSDWSVALLAIDEGDDYIEIQYIIVDLSGPSDLRRLRAPWSRTQPRYWNNCQTEQINRAMQRIKADLVERDLYILGRSSNILTKFSILAGEQFDLYAYGGELGLDYPTRSLNFRLRKGATIQMGDRPIAVAGESPARFLERWADCVAEAAAFLEFSKGTLGHLEQWRFQADVGRLPR